MVLILVLISRILVFRGFFRRKNAKEAKAQKSPLIPLWKRGKSDHLPFARGGVEGDFFPLTIILAYCNIYSVRKR